MGRGSGHSFHGSLQDLGRAKAENGVITTGVCKDGWKCGGGGIRRRRGGRGGAPFSSFVMVWGGQKRLELCRSGQWLATWLPVWVG